MVEIGQAINTFISHCQFEKNLTQKTIQAYTTDLSQFISFLDSNRFQGNVDQLDKEVIRLYVKSISCHKIKTIKRKVASLKAMFNFLEFEDVISSNPFRKLRLQFKEPKYLPVVLTKDEVFKLLRSIYGMKNQMGDRGKYEYFKICRDLAIIETLFATGIRVNELCEIKNKHFHENYAALLVKGKGNKERFIQICHPETIAALSEYSKLTKENGNHNEYFFLNRSRSQLSSQSIRTIIRKYTSLSEIRKNVTPHTFRHTFATLLLEEDVDIKYIQNLLGHSSIVTTQIYTHVNQKKQMQILQSKHPRREFQFSEVSD